MLRIESGTSESISHQRPKHQISTEVQRFDNTNYTQSYLFVPYAISNSNYGQIQKLLDKPALFIYNSLKQTRHETIA
jgi:hypothetical protein